MVITYKVVYKTVGKQRRFVGKKVFRQSCCSNFYDFYTLVDKYFVVQIDNAIKQYQT